MEFIPQCEPFIDGGELKELTEVIRSTMLLEGEKTREFEKKIASYTGSKYAIATTNCSGALFISLKALGVGRGDEVIVSDFSFIAASNAVILCGAKPIFIDIDERSFNMSPDETEKAITKKTKAILPTHVYGQAAETDRIVELARENDLYVVEDAAQGVGVQFKKKHAGTFGDIGCLSFNTNKIITTAAGGMILTNDEKLSEECFMLKNHGRRERGTFVHEQIGYNFYFTDVQAAIGLAQFSKLDKIIELKSRIRKRYEDLLAGLKELEFTYVDPNGIPVHWFTNILVDDPQGLCDYMKKEGVGTRRFFYPLHMQPCYKIEKEYPNTVEAYNKGLSLPSSAGIEDSKIRRICQKIREYFGE